jgi:hypothetical protein
VSKPPFYDITLSLGDADFLREVIDFLEEILEAVDIQDANRECND